MKPAEGDGRPWLEGLFEGAQDALQRAEGPRQRLHGRQGACRACCADTVMQSKEHHPAPCPDALCSAVCAWGLWLHWQKAGENAMHGLGVL